MNKNDKEFMAQKIRTQYVEKQATEIDELRELDARVKRPANVFAYVFGVLAAIVMGCGMSIIMTDIGDTLNIGNTMTVGIIIGSVGLIMALINYPIYNGILGARKKKYSEQILKLSDKILNT